MQHDSAGTDFLLGFLLGGQARLFLLFARDRGDELVQQYRDDDIEEHDRLSRGAPHPVTFTRSQVLKPPARFLLRRRCRHGGGEDGCMPGLRPRSTRLAAAAAALASALCRGAIAGIVARRHGAAKQDAGTSWATDREE